MDGIRYIPIYLGRDRGIGMHYKYFLQSTSLDGPDFLSYSN
jgi:hypothetical protein